MKERNTLIYGKPKEKVKEKEQYVIIKYANNEVRLYVWEITPKTIKVMYNFKFDQVHIKQFDFTTEIFLLHLRTSLIELKKQFDNLK